VPAGNSQRLQIATIVQDDLRQLGMKVSIVSLESRAMLDRINRRDFDAALMALASGDADPNTAMNVWTTGGTLHLWNMKGRSTPWEQEIDRLMRLQMVTPAYPKRKALYDKVQQLIADNLPVICIASPHILVGAHSQLQHFQPAGLRPYTLWNADSLFFANRK
jgi:peptide/nickel transport system substrate-binding protein